MAKLTLNNGRTFEGTAEELLKVLQKQNKMVGPLYNSDSKGEIPVREMAFEHLRNAFIKRLKESADALRYCGDVDNLYKNIIDIFNQDNDLEVLYSEIERLYDEEQ